MSTSTNPRYREALAQGMHAAVGDLYATYCEQVAAHHRGGPAPSLHEFSLLAAATMLRQAPQNPQGLRDAMRSMYATYCEQVAAHHRGGPAPSLHEDTLLRIGDALHKQRGRRYLKGK